jgi:hypothetical protein
MSSSLTRKLWRHPAAPDEAYAQEPALGKSGVAYCVAYGPHNGPIPAGPELVAVRSISCPSWRTRRRGQGLFRQCRSSR